MARKIELDEETLKELALIRDQEESILIKMKNEICSIIPHPVAVEDLYESIKGINCSKKDSEIIINHLLALCNFQEQRDITTERLLELLESSLSQYEGKGKWSDSQLKKWSQKTDVFKKLLLSPQLLTIVKSRRLAYEYDYLFKTGKMITDIRPVFNRDCDEIVASIVSFTLNLSYLSGEGEEDNCVKKITLALDIDDVKNLLNSCDKALKKAEIANKFMKDKNNITSFICGD